MSYYFVNQRFPVSDPNLDLNFNNDILYQHILGDEAMVQKDFPYENADQVPKRARRPTRSDIQTSPPSYNVSLLFIVIVIMILLFYYMAGAAGKTRRSARITLLADGKLIR